MMETIKRLCDNHVKAKNKLNIFSSPYENAEKGPPPLENSDFMLEIDHKYSQ